MTGALNNLCDCGEPEQCYTSCECCGALNIPVTEFGAPELCDGCGHTYMDDDTRLFYVVDTQERNPELFQTQEAAKDVADTLSNNGERSRLRICEVRHSYMDEGRWTYEDQADTFTEVCYL